MTVVARPTALARANIHMCYHTFYLADSGASPEPKFEPGNGLILVQPGVAVVYTGIHTGQVAVSVELWDGRPTELITDGWDEVVEVTMRAPIGQVRVRGPMDNPPEGLPELTEAGPGNYRVRVHARGRDTAPDLVAFEPVEQYNIIIWPGQPADEIVYKQTDEYGASRRRRPPSNS